MGMDVAERSRVHPGDMTITRDRGCATPPPLPDGDHAAEGAWWTQVRGEGPVIATAIHHGTGLRRETAALMQLPEAARVREEDPWTGDMIVAVPTRVVVQRSRFEVDLNRARREAVYRTPAQAWGLEVWREPPAEALVARSLAVHDRFYEAMRALLDGVVRDHGHFVLLDVHSYNHRRDGPTAAPTPPDLAPDINLGTFSMPPGRWDHVLQALEDAVRAFDFPGRRLDVRRDVAFQGKGELARFVHAAYPDTGCAIALEVRKFYMDEWTGVPFRREITALQRLFAALVPVLATALQHSPASASGP